MLAAKVLTTLAAVPAVLSCVPRSTTNSSMEVPETILGPETPSDPETLGYFINHLSLNVNDLDRSIGFYRDIFGMRHMFTHYLSPSISVTYMTHSQGGRNGTGYQTTEELLRYKNNNGGHLEFVHMNTTGKDIPGTEAQTSTFSHIGIIVPDPEAVQERLEDLGVKIYKKVGEPMPTEGYLSDPSNLGDASNLSDEEFAAFRDAMSQLNAFNIFAADPDGNLLEILPLNEPNLFG